MIMKTIEVKSSTITRIGYEENKLAIEYTSGATYVYDNVPAEVFAKLVMADSKGKFVAAEIKNKYTFTKFAKTI